MNEKTDYRPLPPLLQKRLEHLAAEVEREQIAAARTDLVVLLAGLAALFAAIAMVFFA